MPAGSLYIVSTPIGNLEDITFRAVRILKEVDLIAAEDTRHSLKLLRHFGISKPLVSYWSEKEKVRTQEIMDKLLSGLSVALISDAGTPGISDPGAVLIRRAVQEGVTVVPIPGPSAVIAALCVSGLSTEEFVFMGFLPSKSGQRRKELGEAVLEPRTVVFYEAPHRIVETMADMEAVFGARRAVVMREITKLHEETLRGTLPEINAALVKATIAGEYVIMVEGKAPESVSVDEALGEIKILMRRGKGRKEAVTLVAGMYGFSKKELYDKSLQSDGE